MCRLLWEKSFKALFVTSFPFELFRCPSQVFRFVTIFGIPELSKIFFPTSYGACGREEDCSCCDVYDEEGHICPQTELNWNVSGFHPAWSEDLICEKSGKSTDKWGFWPDKEYGFHRNKIRDEILRDDGRSLKKTNKQSLIFRSHHSDSLEDSFDPY